MKGKLYKVVVGDRIINDFENVLNVFSPIDNEIVGSIPKITFKKQVDVIFERAKLAFKNYKKTSFKERKEKLLKFCELLKENWDEITNLIVWEIAKTKRAALEELDRSIDYIKKTINEYEKIINNPIVIDENVHQIKNKVGTFIYEPLGVVLAISPFNYPLNLLITKLAPALISGNVVVFKPATQGSCLGAFISLLLYNSGFSNGEISCLIGKSSEIGDWISKNENIDMISFTGSTRIGRHIASKNPLIPVVLELGGKDAAIVLEDADLKFAAKEIVKGAFSYNGQRCTAIKRVIVDIRKEKELIKLIDEEISKLKVGFAKDGDFDITELIDSKSLKNCLALLLDAYKNKALTNQKIKRKGNILWPIALNNLSFKNKIAWQEQFGPILPIFWFKTHEEAIKICNASEYGLQTSIFTKNINVAKDLAKKLEVGTVNINKASSRTPDEFPFITCKNSGKGLQGIKDSILSMNKLKGIIENE